MEQMVKVKFASYPGVVRDQLMRIRELIFQVAEDEDIGSVTETLKWGGTQLSGKRRQHGKIRLESRVARSVCGVFPL